MLRDTTRQFVENELMPIADEVDASNDFLHHLWQKMGELGLLGITVDERFGGSAMGYLAHIIVLEEISRASASVGLLFMAPTPIFASINCNETARKAKKKNIYLTSAPGQKSVRSP